MAFNVDSHLHQEYTSFGGPSPEEQERPSLLHRLFRRKKKVASEESPGNSCSPALDSLEDVSQAIECGATADLEACDSPALSEDSFAETSRLDERTEMHGLVHWLTRLLYIRDPKRRKEYRRYWMADRDCSECYECGGAFSTFRRRHHCRICGHIFCGRCSSQAVPGACVGLNTATVRACVHCARMYHRYARVSQGLPEGATDEWIVTEAANAGVLASESPPSALRLAVDRHGADVGLVGTMGATAGLECGPPSDASEGGEGLADRRNSFSSLPENAGDSERAVADELQTMSRMSSLPSLAPPCAGPFDHNPSSNAVPISSEALRQEQALVKDNVQLHRIWAQMVHPELSSLKRHNFRHKLSYFTDCVLGCDMVDWLISRGQVATRTQGQVLCQAFLDLRLIRPLQSQSDLIFRDSYIMYHLREMTPEDFQRIFAMEEEAPSESDWEPKWLRDIEGADSDDSEFGDIDVPPRQSVISRGRSTFYSDVDREQRSLRKDSDIVESTNETVTSGDMQRSREDLFDLPIEEAGDEEQEKAFEIFKDNHMRHVHQVIAQMVRRRYLDPEWTDTIVELAQEISASVRPDVKHDGDCMDIRPYVKIKKVAGGSRDECEIVYGLVCTKNLTHRDAATNLKMPSLLLIESPIDIHERKEGKEFVTLDSQIRQEENAIRNCVMRIVELMPSLVVTQRNVAFRAQELLREEGIALVTNMKEANMWRLRRCTHATIVESVQSLHAQSSHRLGTCFKFRVKAYPVSDAPASHSYLRVGKKEGLSAYESGSKTLMFFEECGKHFGCTLILRGGTLSELVRVKEICRFAVFAFYNCRLEIAYARDCGICPLSQISPDDSGLTMFNKKSVASDDATPNSFLEQMNRHLLSISALVDIAPPYLATVDNAECPLRKNFGPLLDFPPRRKLNHMLKAHLRRQRAERYELERLQPKLNPRLVRLSPPALLRRGLDAPAALRPSSNAELRLFRRQGGTLRYAQGRHPLLGRQTWEVRRPPTKIEAAATQNQLRRRTQLEWSAFEVSSHQKIAVLFSCHLYDPAAEAFVACVHPWTISMHFYGRHDLTLGHFLESYCFRPHYNCPNAECTQPMLKHERRFVHAKGQLAVLLRKTQKPAANENIFTWTWCRECRKPSRKEQLSPDTWHLSFAKFLDLHFHMASAASSRLKCGHSYHHSQFQYFQFKDSVASFKYERVKLFEVFLPPNQVVLDPPKVLSDDLIMKVNNLVSWSNQMIASIFEYVHCLGGRAPPQLLPVVKQFFDELDDNRKKLQLMVEPLQLCLSSEVFYPPEDDEDDGIDRSASRRTDLLIQIDEQMTEVRLWIAQVIHFWNCKIPEYQSRERKLFREARSKRPSRSGDLDNASAASSVPTTRDPSPHRLPGSPQTVTRSIPPPMPTTTPAPPADNNSPGLLGPPHLPTWSSSPPVAVLGAANSTDTALGHSDNPSSGGEAEESLMNCSVSTGIHAALSGSEEVDMESSSQSYVILSPETAPASEPKPPTTDSPDGRPKIEVEAVDAALSNRPSKSSDKLGKIKLFSKLFPGSDKDKFEIPSPPHEHPMLPACAVTPVLVCDDQPSSIIAYVLSSAEYRSRFEELMTTASISETSAAAAATINPKEFEDSGEVLSQNRALTVRAARANSSGGLSSKRSLGLLGGKRAPEEGRSRVSTIVKYIPRNDSSDSLENDTPSEEEEEEETIGRDPDMEAAESEVGGVAGDNTDSGSLAPAQLNEKHITIQMTAGSAQFYCKVYFAREFEAVRQAIFPQGEKVYIRSLSKCASWAAAGGKSGSTFLKTLDDRFILKQMSQAEIVSFQDFAPFYFEYITRIAKTEEPCVLTKILGVYYIGWKTPSTGEKMAVLVMENLLYNRKVKQLFDLKGSRRNRLAATKSPKPGQPGAAPSVGASLATGAQGVSNGSLSATGLPSSRESSNPVLLDENFIKQSQERPLYLRWHSKTSLHRAIEADTTLLSHNFVMDYSLLVGIDEQNKELVVGIIDYMRTFTWDKRIEYILKSTVGAGTAQGASRQPTVVSPEVYRARFLQAMHHYFLESPDQWHDLLERHVEA